LVLQLWIFIWLKRRWAFKDDLHSAKSKIDKFLNLWRKQMECALFVAKTLNVFDQFTLLAWGEDSVPAVNIFGLTFSPLVQGKENHEARIGGGTGQFYKKGWPNTTRGSDLEGVYMYTSSLVMLLKAQLIVFDTWWKRRILRRIANLCQASSAADPSWTIPGDLLLWQVAVSLLQCTTACRFCPPSTMVHSIAYSLYSYKYVCMA
jgi:hypothetical protein